MDKTLSNMYLKCTTVQTCKISTSQQKAIVMIVLNKYLSTSGRSFKVRFILNVASLTFIDVRFLNAQSVAQLIMSDLTLTLIPVKNSALFLPPISIQTLQYSFLYVNKQQSVPPCLS